MHPADIDALGQLEGQRIDIPKNVGQMAAHVDSDSSLRCGIVSMAHCWAGMAAAATGAINVLVDARNHNQTINHMAVRTAILVGVHPAQTPGAEHQTLIVHIHIELLRPTSSTVKAITYH